MSFRYKVHTNIALDYPASKSGYIYASDNVEDILTQSGFREKLKSKQLFGTFGNPLIKFPKEEISHWVCDAFISKDKEIMFEIETLDNEPGRRLSELLEKSEYAAIAKLVARLSKTVVNGKLTIYDIKHVHMVEYDYESFNVKKD